MIDVLERPASRARGDLSRQFKFKTSQSTQETIDGVPTHAQESSDRAQLFVVEDNEAVIQMIIQGRSSHTRCVSRTHRLNLEWLSDRVNMDLKISVTNVHSRQHIADMSTKGSLTSCKWNELMILFCAVPESFHHSPFSVVAALVLLSHPFTHEASNYSGASSKSKPVGKKGSVLAAVRHERSSPLISGQEKTQSDVTGQVNPSLTSGDRLHSPGSTRNPEVTEPEASNLEG